MIVNVSSVAGPKVTVSGLVEYAVNMSVDKNINATIKLNAVQGPPGPPAKVSSDLNNTAVIGTDGGIHVPHFTYSTTDW